MFFKMLALKTILWAVVGSVPPFLSKKTYPANKIFLDQLIVVSTQRFIFVPHSTPKEEKFGFIWLGLR